PARPRVPSCPTRRASDLEVITAGQLDQRPAGLVLEVGGIDDGEAAPGEALLDDVVDQLEGVAADVLGVLVVADGGAVVVGGDDLDRKSTRLNSRHEWISY